MIEYIPLALSSLNAAKNIASSLLNLRDFDKIASATIELKSHLVQTYDHIISEKERVLAFQERISELEKECNRLKDWSAEKEKYTRRQISPGVFAYIIKDYKGPLEEAHKLCCDCFDNNKKSTLQQFRIDVGRKTGLSCHNKCPDLVFQSYYKDVETM